MPKMNLSDAGKRALIGSEGCRLKPYLCSAGVPTIGFGSTAYADGKRVKLTDPPLRTVEDANTLFKLTIEPYIATVNVFVKVELSQGQFDALVSLVYNIGIEAFKGSTLLKKLNARDYEGAAAQFDRWVRSNGKVSPGLVARRARERKVFERG